MYLNFSLTYKERSYDISFLDLRIALRENGRIHHFGIGEMTRETRNIWYYHMITLIYFIVDLRLT